LFANAKLCRGHKHNSDSDINRPQRTGYINYVVPVRDSDTHL